MQFDHFQSPADIGSSECPVQDIVLDSDLISRHTRICPIAIEDVDDLKSIVIM